MILVTGATGSVGRHVVDGLLKEGQFVRAVTRNPATAGLPAAVEVVEGDLSAPEHLPLDGVTTAYLIAMGDNPYEVAQTLADNGVSTVVFLSTSEVLDDTDEQPGAIAARHAAFEDAIQRSGMLWTFLRPNEFAGNVLQWADQVKAGDVVRAPYGDAWSAPIHERDVAAAAVRALVDDRFHGAKLVLTGPEAMTHREQLGHIASVLGRKLEFEELPAAAVRERMARFAPVEIVDALLGRLAETVGKPTTVTSTVYHVTGRRPLTFREWVAEHVEDFR
ncbi:NAD(P)H-binding protein [Nonomuraea sp. PA05]|uniref:SDR family oxidoreductase n=1 Tax=Nonomuraea sp. PA05 TaxID=2604466 RepID=UPI0011D92D25|nr:NAD(P)H-binding protein [Nonomuraea sp. PA05]TYB60550.1 NAD(P)H-binding protein [Nonomuraea sp. PA05]